jgi:hypothetical protein
VESVLISNWACELTEKPTPFVLFFDRKLLESLRRKYGFGIIEGVHRVFLESAHRQNLRVRKMTKEELKKWRKEFDKMVQDNFQFYKDAAKVALIGLLGTSNVSDVIEGLEFEDSKSIVLISVFEVGTVFKRFIWEAMAFSSTKEGKEDMYKYFRSLVSEASGEPISEQSWKSIEKIRKRMAAKTLDIEGFEENLWKRIL